MVRLFLCPLCWTARYSSGINNHRFTLCRVSKSIWSQPCELHSQSWKLPSGSNGCERQCWKRCVTKRADNAYELDSEHWHGDVECHRVWANVHPVLKSYPYSARLNFFTTWGLEDDPAMWCMAVVTGWLTTLCYYMADGCSTNIVVSSAQFED